jgi:signal peptidase
MPIAPLATRVLRRTLDGLLVALIAAVLVTILLTRALPLIAGGTTLVVAGASMEPTIPMGSLVFDLPAAADALHPGDVVSIRVGAERAVFTHRVTRIAELADGTYVETRGDANPTVDPALVPVSAVIGRTTLSIPYLGFAVAVLSTVQGVALLFAVAGMLLAGAWLVESFEEEQGEARRRGERAALPDLRADPAPELEARA